MRKRLRKKKSPVKVPGWMWVTVADFYFVRNPLVKLNRITGEPLEEPLTQWQIDRECLIASQWFAARNWRNHRLMKKVNSPHLNEFY